MGLETLQGHRDKAMLKLWYKSAFMSDPKWIFTPVWEMPNHVAGDREKFGCLDKDECLEDMEEGDSSLKALLALVDESIGERKSRKFMEGLVKLALYTP